MGPANFRGLLIMDYVALYQQLIGWVVGQFGNDKIAHVFVGLTLWLGSVRALRKTFNSLAPFVVLAVAEAINEGLDRITYGSWRWADTSMDIAATFACPLLILLMQSCRTFALKRQGADDQKIRARANRVTATPPSSAAIPAARDTT